MRYKKSLQPPDTSVAVTTCAKNELEAVRRYKRQTKRLCLEDLIHEAYMKLPKEVRDFFMQKCE